MDTKPLTRILELYPNLSRDHGDLAAIMANHLEDAVPDAMNIPVVAGTAICRMCENPRLAGMVVTELMKDMAEIKFKTAIANTLAIGISLFAVSRDAPPTEGTSEQQEEGTED